VSKERSPVDIPCVPSGDEAMYCRSSITPIIAPSNWLWIAKGVHPKHNLMGIIAVPDIVGSVETAGFWHGDIETTGQGFEGLDGFSDVFATVGIGFHSTPDLIGPYTPITGGIYPKGLWARLIAPHIITQGVAIGNKSTVHRIGGPVGLYFLCARGWGNGRFLAGR